MEETMATKSKTPKPTTKKKKASTNAKAAKPKAPKEDLVVFAFRLTEAERTKIHETAGPRNATQFVRRVAVAFAHEDEESFRRVLKEAREARA